MIQVTKRFASKKIVLTGASSGLGKAIANQLAEEGADLILIARRKTVLEEMVNRYTHEYHSNSTFYSCDLADETAVSQLIAYLTQLPTVDYMINCAGYGRFDFYSQLQTTDTKNLFMVNTLSPIAISKAMASKMSQQGFGHIVNICSQAAKIATPKTTTYSASKAALYQYSNALRLELEQSASNVLVTTINPGPIKTPFFEHADREGNYLTNLGNFVLEPDDVAKKTVNALISYKREVNQPRLMAFASKLYNLFPTFGDWLIVHFFDKK